MYDTMLNHNFIQYRANKYFPCARCSLLLLVYYHTTSLIYAHAVVIMLRLWDIVRKRNLKNPMPRRGIPCDLAANVSFVCVAREY